MSDTQLPDIAPLRDMCDELKRTTVDVFEVSPEDFATDDFAAPALRTAIEFYRQHVAQSKPCIIRGLLLGCDALERWTENEYLIKTLDGEGDEPEPHLTVACTPNGRADAATSVCHAGGDEKLFMGPHEETMTAKGLFSALRLSLQNAPSEDPYRADLTNPTPRLVAYAQMQNDCLNSEYAKLKADFPDTVRNFGKAVFGQAADVENLWIGNDAAVTAMHDDWYENLYAVVRGEKVFTLVPPWEATFVPKTELPSASYTFDGKTWSIEREEDPTPWIEEDIYDTMQAGRPLNPNLHPMNVVVEPGDVLYLPATWFHRVGQRRSDPEDPEDCVVAVNYWFDTTDYWLRSGPLSSATRALKRTYTGTDL